MAGKAFGRLIRIIGTSYPSRSLFQSFSHFILRKILFGLWTELSSMIPCSRFLKKSGRFCQSLVFRQMVDLRGSFVSGIAAQKNYGDYREFIKVIQEAIEGRKVLQLL